MSKVNILEGRSGGKNKKIGRKVTWKDPVKINATKKKTNTTKKRSFEMPTWIV